MPLEELRYFHFAERWHWTPEQVDRLPLKFYRWAPILMDAVDEVRKQIAEGGDD